ncbi:proline-rich receptor-like protein kinase PERK10 [Andrographis paniculata]|uniref:proline-rich receptor-like protein kinase PERK10 n=1 Tax=Andrographis paniculata TaxID=175694 RepID=UPI0021E98867|nr:proline-rich receptor-like protein kinase PERK10 [Andrographis paniculata]
MDSGSLHSSSTAGDDEYDSRAAAASFFQYDPFPNFITTAPPVHQNPFPTTLPGSDPNPAPPELTNPPPRNPRKRSRPSRRAPTTVMTTDTANFRAMVQEFTGVPSPPLDLYGSRSLFQAPQDILRRPLARNNPQSPPAFLHSSPTNSIISSISSTIGTDPINHQLFLPQQNPKFLTSNPPPTADSKPHSIHSRSDLASSSRPLAYKP